MTVKAIYSFLLLGLLFPLRMLAQDITGLWKGELYVDSTKKYLPYEVAISEYKGKLKGFSWILFTDSGRDETGTREISIRQKGDEIILEDDDFINNTYIKQPPKQIRKLMVVKLTIKDTIMTLEGGWSTNRTKRFLSATGTVKLQRRYDFKQTSELYKKLDTLKRAEELVFNEPPPRPAPPVAVVVPVKQETKPTPTSAITIDPDKQEPVAKIPPPPVKKEPEPVVVKEPTPPPVAVLEKPKPVPPKPVPVVEKPKPAPAPKPTPPPVVVVEKPKPAPAPKPAPPVVAPKPVPAKPAPVLVVAAPPPPKPVARPTPPPTAVVIDPNAAAEVSKRKIASTQGIFFESDSLVLTLYDNGSVDGDTVSVLMNGGLIFAKQGLTTTANNKTIYITPDMGDSIKLVMYAENLGSIPPNTGLLVVKDGEKTYYLRFSADLSSNAQIILQRKRKDE